MGKLTTLVIDDFYPDPLRVRTYALSLPYQDATTERDQRYYRGLLSTPYHPFAAFGMQIISEGIGRLAISQFPCGEFRQLRQANQAEVERRPWVHCDSSAASYSAIVYLNLPAQCRGGTAFYRHRQLGIDRMPRPGSVEAAHVVGTTGLRWEEIARRTVEDGYEVEAKWEMTGRVAMRFNRCLIFESSLFHARIDRFGTNAADARLTQNYFFDLTHAELRAPHGLLWP